MKRRQPALAVVAMAVTGLAAMAVAPAAPQPGGAEGEWTRPARDFAGTRFSPLDQIRAENARELKLA
jgi:glucose dehydrogenase